MVEVATPQGPGRCHVSAAAAPVALLALGHGAGGGVDAPDLLALAHRLPAYGVSVLRLEQPWRVAGRRVAVRPPLLDEAWLAGLVVFLEGTGRSCRSSSAVGARGRGWPAARPAPSGRSGSSA